MARSRTISMQFHPRAFSAFGADLVTNDTVAVTELVKNCYDAFAYHVEVEFGEDKHGKFIQISDDGIGMTNDIIENSWAVIATPYKEKNPTVSRAGRVRRVSGNKGLGRFSAARLGNVMHIWTKHKEDEFFHAKMDWNSFLESNNVNDCRIQIEELPQNDIFNPTGTILRIRKLSSEWDKTKIDELRDNLSRLVSPFKKLEQFTITLVSPFYEAPIEIKPTKLIEQPTYRIWGNVDAGGTIHWSYIFDPVNDKQHEQNRSASIPWKEACRGFNTNAIFLDSQDTFQDYTAGPFTFEIRCWDLDNDSLDDLTRVFDLKRRAIRNIISQYKGLSIYRDDVLVLPKSNASKDWLGIDLRRISSLGTRISTSQIVGIVNISSSDNPEIRDTTDREKLVDTKEFEQFSKIIETIISQLERLRTTDKSPEKHQEKPNINSLMAPLSAQSLVRKIEDAVEKGAQYEDILEYVKEYSAQNEKGIQNLQSRLTYYAQTASLGSVAIVILHEVLTGMTVIKRFLRRVFKEYSPFDTRTQEYFEDAEKSHERLLDVAKSFSPLYRQDLRKTHNKCNLRAALDSSIRLIRGQKSSINVVICENDVPNLFVSMHDGELQTIFVNLLDNACYWLQKNIGEKIIDINYEILENRIRITISDNGPGIKSEDAQLIFNAGVTAKPHGIGMGLAIVTELLDCYDGKIATVIPGTMEGATFVFDVPIA